MWISPDLFTSVIKHILAISILVEPFGFDWVRASHKL